MAEPATKDDVAEVHRRVDHVVETIGDMKQDLGEIKGSSAQTANSLDSITDMISKGVGTQANSELMKTVRWLIVAVVLGGAIAAGMTQFSASSGDKAISVSKQGIE